MWRQKLWPRAWGLTIISLHKLGQWDGYEWREDSVSISLLILMILTMLTTE